MSSLLEAYRRQDTLLAQAGIPRTPPKWMELIERFYCHPTAKRLVARIGRGGAKSTHGVKMAVCETLFGDFLNIGPGECHYFVFVSERMKEAYERLRLLEKYLSVLGVAYDRKDDTINLRGLPRGFKVLACSIGSVSGFRCIGCVEDECAKWDNDGVNPAPEVTASVDAMMITHPQARSRLISSPMSTVDHHYELMEQGDTQDQIVASGPSWEWNPTITREQCIAAAKGDSRIFAREYCAIPQDAISAAFDAEAVDAALRYPPPGRARVSRPILCCDPSSGGADMFAWCVVQWLHPAPPPFERRVEWKEGDDGVWRGTPNEPPPPPKPFLYVYSAGYLDGGFWGEVDAETIVKQLVDLCRARGIQHVHCDQRERLGLASIFRRHGAIYHEHPFSNTSKADAVSRLSVLLRDRQLIIEPSAAGKVMRDQMVKFKRKYTRSGLVQFEGKVDDLVGSLIVAMHAELEPNDYEGTPGSPVRAPSGKTIYEPGCS